MKHLEQGMEYGECRLEIVHDLRQRSNTIPDAPLPSLHISCVSGRIEENKG